MSKLICLLLIILLLHNIGHATSNGLIIEAEDYSEYFDNTEGNACGAYRLEDVDIESCSEGGFSISWIESGEWLEYTISGLDTDTYDIFFRVARLEAESDAGSLSILLDGSTTYDAVNIPNTKSWQLWQDVCINNVFLEKGEHTLRVSFQGSFNFNYLYLASSTNPPIPPLKPALPPVPTPPDNYCSMVNRYGQLQVIDNKLCDQNGNPVQLRGVSSHHLQWVPFVDNHTIANLAYNWGISVIRPAMYVEDYKNGESYGGIMLQPEYMKAKLLEMVQDAIDAGIYVLIDWHIHNNPMNFVSEASFFFEEMATLFGKYPNIIYEICNEPEYTEWNVVKQYANTIIPLIRTCDPDNIVLVGTPEWCQAVDIVADDPLDGYSNIMYTMHFYAGSHQQNQRDRAQYALNKGLPLFISEWGTSNHTGGLDHQFFLEESRTWLDWMNNRNISWINWSFGNKSESSAALVYSARMSGPWKNADLTESGKLVKSMFEANKIPYTVPIILNTENQPIKRTNILQKNGTSSISFNVNGLECQQICINIFNTKGTLVKKISNISPRFILDISGFPPGLYTVEISIPEISTPPKMFSNNFIVF